MRARHAFRDGDPQNARAALASALATAPDDAGLQVEVARALTDAGMHGDALALHRQLLERDDPPSESVVVLSRAWVDAGSVEAAITLLSSAIAARPREAALRCAIANAYERAGRLREAAAQAEIAFSIAPGEAEAYRIHGHVSGQLRDTSACVESWRHAVSLAGPSDLHARTALGIALSNASRHDEAIRELSDVAALSPSADTFANLGMALFEAGRAPDALTALRRATAIQPSHGQAQLGVGLALLSLGATPDAVLALRCATELEPQSATCWFNLAIALRRHGALPDARRAAARAAGLDHDDVEIQALLDELASPPGGPADAQITGDLTSFPLPDLIEFLRSGAKTGAVVIAAPKGAGLVHLDHGRITSANAPSTVRLGPMLVARGFVDRASLDEALSVQHEAPEHAERVGVALLRAGLVDRERLTSVVLDQTLAALEEILGWSEGSFSFHRDRGEVANAADPDLISFDAQFVMMELFRIRDERGRKPMGHRGDRVQ